MKITPRAGLLGLFLLMVPVVWIHLASDYRDSVFLGTYHLDQGSESCNLTIRANQTFQQEVIHDGITQRSNGRWRRTGEEGLVFSREFLPLTGQELGADGTSFGRLNKSLGLFPSIALAQEHVLWFSKTDASQDDSIAGTYAGDEAGASATLVLRNDQTFEQTASHAGQTRQAHGSWSLRENGNILFSRDFLKTSGEPLTRNETASAWGPRGSNLQVKVAMNPSVPQPVFKKTMLVH